MHFGLIVVAVWVLLTALWYILPTARADVYDLLLARTTEKWYAPRCSLARALGLCTSARAAPSQLAPASTCIGWKPQAVRGCSAWVHIV